MASDHSGPADSFLPANVDQAPRVRPALWLLVAAVATGGGWALVRAIQTFPVLEARDWAWVTALALLTIVTGGIRVKVPGQPATVSVSEFFVFVMLLLFGPALTTVAVALDGLWSSLLQKNRRAYRTIFNISEPALGIWSAGSVYVAIIGTAPIAGDETGLWPLLAVLAMTMTCFASNSVLASLAVGLENCVSPYQLWKRHSFYLAVNYYAAAALALLAIDSGMRLAVLVLIAPLLILSYVAYRAVSVQAEESHQHMKDVERLYQATIETLAIAVDAKDEVTHGHVRRVQRHTVTLAHALGVSDPIAIKAIEAAALLHDVGKLAVPDYVLNKPGALTRSEFEKIKLHVNAGAAILSVVDFPYPVVPIVRGHHEQWNGQGYPDGLAGEAIPIGARILTVVDCFDAVTSDRPYRRKLTDDDAIAILRSRSGTMYDPRVVDAFVAMVPELRREDAALDHAAPAAIALLQTTNASTGDGRATADQATVSLPELSHCAPAAFARLGRHLPDAEACLLYQPAGGDHLKPAHSTALVQDALANGTLRLGEGVSGWVACHRYRIVNSDPSLDLGEAAHHLNLRSCMSVPVFAFGDLVGVLSVYLPRPRGFGDREVRLVGTVAQELGLDVTRSHHDRADAVERSAMLAG